ncbi:MAG: GNAT family protein [Ktedonobacterales bacterium]
MERERTTTRKPVTNASTSSLTPLEEPIYNIVGEKVALGPGTREETINLFNRSDNDFAVSIFSGDPLRPVIREATEADYDRYSKGDASREVGFLIYDRATSKAIGAVSLRHIDPVRQTAEFGIVISDKARWGKGYGTESTILMLDYGFTVLGLHNVLLMTYAYNERAIRAYKRAGFREIGRWREAMRIGTRHYDVLYMDCLASEFTSPLKPVVEYPE